MYYIGVDLGSTNIKVAIYSKAMKLVDRQSYPVDYIRENGFVEFDADLYCNNIKKLISSLCRSNRCISKIRRTYSHIHSFGNMLS